MHEIFTVPCHSITKKFIQWKDRLIMLNLKGEFTELLIREMNYDPTNLEF